MYGLQSISVFGGPLGSEDDGVPVDEDGPESTLGGVLGGVGGRIAEPDPTDPVHEAKKARRGSGESEQCSAGSDVGANANSNGDSVDDLFTSDGHVNLSVRG